jgi:hypothetical protein
MSITYLYEKYARKMTICLLASNSCIRCTIHSKQAMMSLKVGITPTPSYSCLPITCPSAASRLPVRSAYTAHARAAFVCVPIVDRQFAQENRRCLHILLPRVARFLPAQLNYAWSMTVADRTSEKLILAMFARLFPMFYPPFSQVLPVLACYAGDGAVVSVQASRVQQLFSASSDAFQREFRRHSDVTGYDHTARSNFSGFLPGWFPVHAWFGSGLSWSFWKGFEYALSARAAGDLASVLRERGNCYE